MDTPDKNKSTKGNEPSPIIDGDSRPDINLNPEEKENRDHPIEIPGEKKKEKTIRDKRKTTPNRVDTDSLEDFRDAID